MLRTLLLVATASILTFAQQTPSENLKPVNNKVTGQLLPKGEITPEIQRITGQIQAMMAFRDPETGELRAPDAAEHRALTARSAKIDSDSRRSVDAPQAIQLPNGAIVLPLNPSNLDFMVVSRDSSGALHADCKNPLHRHTRSAAPKPVQAEGATNEE